MDFLRNSGINGKSKQNGRIIIFLIVLFGLILRMIALGTKSIYVDEGVTIFLSCRPVDTVLPFMMSIKEVHPPLYFWFVSLWMGAWKFFALFFHSFEAYIRFSSVISGVLSIYMTYLTGKKLFSFRVGILASFFMAVSTFNIVYSQELRMYPMLLFLAASSLYLFILLLEKPDFFKASLFVLANSASILTHYFSFHIFIIEIGFLIFLLFRRYVHHHPISNPQLLTAKPGLHLVWIVIPQLISVLSCSWWIPYFLRQLGHQNFTLRQNPSLTDFFLLFSRMAFGDNFNHPHILNFDVFILFSIIPLFLIARQLHKIARQDAFPCGKDAEGQEVKITGKVFVLLWLFLPLLVTLLITFTKFHIFEFKYFLIITPALWLLAADSLLNMKFKALAGALIIFIISFNLFTGWNFQNSTFFQGQNWKETASIITKEIKPGEKVIIHPSMMTLPFLYYYKDKDSVMPMDEIDEKRINSVTGNTEGIWLVSTINHPFVRQSELIPYFMKRYPGYVAGQMESYNPADVIRIYHFNLRKGE